MKRFLKLGAALAALLLAACCFAACSDDDDDPEVLQSFAAEYKITGLDSGDCTVTIYDDGTLKVEVPDVGTLSGTWKDEGASGTVSYEGTEFTFTQTGGVYTLYADGEEAGTITKK